MFEVKNVTKRYGKVIANRDISFQVEDGQIAVLLGPNGAGKSTIIKCIAGLLRFSGEITIGGYPGKSREARAMLGYLPEMPAVYDLLTVWEHMQFIARAYRLTDWQGRPRRCSPGLSCGTRRISWARSCPRACSRR